jgi:hypothetical protein
MALAPYLAAFRAAVFLLALATVVHASPFIEPAYAQAPGSPSANKSNPAKAPAGGNRSYEVRYGTAGLPGPVVEMREAILAAVKSGRIEDLTAAIELNEIKPAFSAGPVSDPIATLRSNSADGEGREVLAALGDILESGYVAVPAGRDIENNRIYVWPYFAETGTKTLSPSAEVELYRLAPAADVRRMRDTGRYDGWRIGIGADGVWHFLLRGPGS